MRPAKLLISTLFVFSCTFSQAYGQSKINDIKPVNYEEILRKLSSADKHTRVETNRELIAEIQQRRVDFILFDEDRNKFKKAGGSKELLKAIDDALPQERKNWLAERRRIYETVVQNYGGTPEQKKIAENAASEYLSKFGDDEETKPQIDWLKYYLGIPKDPELHDVSAKDCLKYGDGGPEINRIKPLDVSEYVSWQKFETSSFSVYLPSQFKRKAVRCIDSGCYHFDAPDMVISIDITEAAGRPFLEKSYKSYCQKWYEIDGAIAWIWNYEYADSREASEYKYQNGVLFTSNKGRWPLFNIVLSSNTADSQELADKIFKSVTFTKRELR